MLQMQYNCVIKKIIPGFIKVRIYIISLACALIMGPKKHKAL